MKILIFHGYLLHGSGSNVYNAELARVLVGLGHDVHLLCQESEFTGLDWVSHIGDWDSGGLQVRTVNARSGATVYRPNIGRRLPVYVADRYPGFDAKPFPELSIAELEFYLERNVAGVADVVTKVDPEIALANHLVMGPAILARALGDRVPYAVKIHGSALEYTVKPHRDRFLSYAEVGLARATAVLVGSRHTAESLWETVTDPDLPGKTWLGPPGVDINAFRSADSEESWQRLSGLIADFSARSSSSSSDGSSFARDDRAAFRALKAIADDDRPILFVGKWIASKGVELLLAAWPYVVAVEPRARLVLVGYGAFEQGLHQISDRLAAGDLNSVADIRGENGQRLDYLTAFLSQLDEQELLQYRDLARTAFSQVQWVGRLIHSELVSLMGVCEAQVVPSTFPEAFGMVAAETAACGILPIVADHSGLAEVVEELGESLDPRYRSMMSFELGEESVPQLAKCLGDWLALDSECRSQVCDRIERIARDRFSWEGVASTVVAAASGDRDSLVPIETQR